MDTPHPADDAPISPKSAKLAIALEKTVFPLIYAFLAYQRLSAALENYRLIKIRVHFRSVYLHEQEFLYASFIKNILLFALIALYGVMLLFSRPATALPTQRKHLLIPIAMSFYFALYGMLSYLPPSLSENLLPPSWQFPCALIGAAVSLIGYCISIWAIAYLRRSFAIFVAVRDVVSKGPYAYVRHPIYLGYLFDLCGLTLASFSLAILFLGCGFVWLLVERARMEEEKLCEASPSYRQYARSTGFLFPRLRSSAPPATS
jgi:protein-S-isoprenylcysteine O-methyltransferase Ste14